MSATSVAQTAVQQTSLWQRLYLAYRLLWVQRSIAILVLAGAAALQYRLVNVPIADLSQTSKFGPATVKAADQVVSFRNPESGPGTFSFAYDQTADSQKQRMVVDAYFDNASLTGETIGRLAALNVHPPSQPGPVNYLTSVGRNGTCDTSVH